MKDHQLGYRETFLPLGPAIKPEPKEVKCQMLAFETGVHSPSAGVLSRGSTEIRVAGNAVSGGRGGGIIVPSHEAKSDAPFKVGDWVLRRYSRSQEVVELVYNGGVASWDESTSLELAPPEPTQDADGWITWVPYEGAKAPACVVGVACEVKYQCGVFMPSMDGGASWLYWGSPGPWDPIVAYRLKPQSTQAKPDADGWIKHDGGPCPCVGRRIQIRRADGSWSHHPFAADSYGSAWESSRGARIVAYRFAEESQA